eukprot:scaffold40091_cov60-Phaeocystis_antarctica.AAC.2
MRHRSTFLAMEISSHELGAVVAPKRRVTSLLADGAKVGGQSGRGQIGWRAVERLGRQLLREHAERSERAAAVGGGGAGVGGGGVGGDRARREWLVMTEATERLVVPPR